MSSILRSGRAKLFSSFISRTFSSFPRSSHPIHSSLHSSVSDRSPSANENPSKENLTGQFRKLYNIPPLNTPITMLGCDSSNISNPLRYNAAGQDTNVQAGAGYGNGSSGVWAAKGSMLLGVNAVMARSFDRSADAHPLGLTGHNRFMSDVAGTINETKPYSLRPLSPHLPVYQPQLSSTLSIFNRISGALLSTVILLFYMIYMKMGLISLSYDSFYQFLFYSSKLNLLAVEISGLALAYHLYAGIRHLVPKV